MIDRLLPLAVCVALLGLATPASAQFTGLSTEVVDFGRVLDGQVMGTVRLYADLTNPQDKVSLWGGVAGSPLAVNTTDPQGFWQHPSGGDLLPVTCALEEQLPNVRYDSYLTIGSGPALNASIDFFPFNNGGGINAAAGVLFGVQGCPVNGKVLLGQFTVRAGYDVSGTLWISGFLPAPPSFPPLPPPSWNATASFSVTVTAPASVSALGGSPPSLSLAAGGIHTLTLATSDPHTGTGPCFVGDLYVIVGSAAGTSGFPALPSAGGDLLVPLLTPDPYFDLTLTCPGLPLFTGLCGLTDANAAATATVNLPAGLPPILAGVTLSHLAVVIRAGVGIVHLSNPAPLALTM